MEPYDSPNSEIVSSEGIKSTSWVIIFVQAAMIFSLLIIIVAFFSSFGFVDIGVIVKFRFPFLAVVTAMLLTLGIIGLFKKNKYGYFIGMGFLIISVAIFVYLTFFERNNVDSETSIWVAFIIELVAFLIFLTHIVSLSMLIFNKKIRNQFFRYNKEKSK